MTQHIFRFCALAILLTGLVGCGAGSAQIPNVDPVKEPLMAYAAELRYQDNLLLQGHKDGKLDQKEIDAFLASWNRIGKFYKAARKEWADFSESEQHNFIEANFKYPSPSGSQYLNGGSLGGAWLTNGFLGTSINKKTGEIMAIHLDSLDFLEDVYQTPTYGSTISNLGDTILDIANDLDPILRDSQKKENADKLVYAVLSCFPEKKWTPKTFYLRNDSGDIASLPYPTSWYPGKIPN